MPIDATQLPFLTPAEQLALANGKLSTPQAAMRNAMRYDSGYAQGDFITPILDATRPARTALQQNLEFGKTVNPNVPPIVQNASDAFSNVMLAATNPWENLLKPTGEALSSAGQAVYDANKDSAPIQLAQKAYDATFKTQGELAAAKAAEQQAAMQVKLAEDTTAANKINAFDAILGQQQGANGAMIIGPAPQTSGGALQLPMPPAGPDYSGVQAALDKTKPTDITKDVEDHRKGAILTGLIGGLLQASMDGNNSAGQVLASGGLGVLKGMSEADAYKRQAEDNFKQAIDQYWIRTAGVRRDQAESDAQYANRVYETKIAQLKLNAAAAAAKQEAGQSKLRQAGDKFFVEETVQTPQGPMRQMRPLDVEAVDRMGGMEKHITQLLGGTEDAKKKATAIVAEVATRKDPEYGLAMLTLARMKANGTYLDLVKQISNQDPEFQNVFNSVGIETQGMPVADDTQLKKIADARRDTLLISLMMKNKSTRDVATKLAGLEAQIGGK